MEQGECVELMRRALELARRGLESVSPNPMVGAVLARAGRIIGEGYHHRAGGPHAEVEALRVAAVDSRGADLYVTLEPCSHQGKTPPCTDAILRAGIARVCFAARDPNPLTRGVGPRILRRAGVEVSEGVLRAECEALNAPFFHWITTGSPWIVLKWAMTLDGRTATASGESRWITGREARRHAHGLRRRVDAVLVGTGTLLADDPLLTPRPARGRRPLRVVLDRRGRLPLGLRLLQPGGGGPGERLYVTSPRCPERRRRRVAARGLRVLVVPEWHGSIDLEALFRELGAVQVSQVLVEGGAALAGSCLERGLVQEIAVHVAPRVLGEAGARPAVEAPGPRRLADALRLESVEVTRLGRDVLVQARVPPGTGR